MSRDTVTMHPDTAVLDELNAMLDGEPRCQSLHQGRWHEPNDPGNTNGYTACTVVAVAVAKGCNRSALWCAARLAEHPGDVLDAVLCPRCRRLLANCITVVPV